MLPKQGKLPPLDLLSIAQAAGEGSVPPDCYGEVFDAIPAGSRPHDGEWILIYGGECRAMRSCSWTSGEIQCLLMVQHLVLPPSFASGLQNQWD